MIIGFAGRLQSGKTELSKICEEYGYERLYFAKPLKELCADILDTSIDELNKAKLSGVDISLPLNEDIRDIISIETNIDRKYVDQVCEGKTIHSVRLLLQFIGTDLIRRYNVNWHVDKIRSMVEPNKNYVFDDVRFPNEKKMIEDFGGDVWFIVRPILENVSNHYSETSLQWGDCYNRVIINDRSLEFLKFKWKTFFDTYEESKRKREEVFQHILNKCDYPSWCDESMLTALFIDKAMFTYVPKEANIAVYDFEKCQSNPNGYIIHFANSTRIIDNPLELEDIKVDLNVF